MDSVSVEAMDLNMLMLRRLWNLSPFLFMLGSTCNYELFFYVVVDFFFSFTSICFGATSLELCNIVVHSKIQLTYMKKWHMCGKNELLQSIFACDS